MKKTYDEKLRKMRLENSSARLDRTFAEAAKCPACGARALRKNAKFCFTCGKLLKEDYQPLDTLRASYRLQGRSFFSSGSLQSYPTDLFKRRGNSISQTAWACCVYSMVPYLGIFFIPFTLILSTLGAFVSYRSPELGGGKLALVSIATSFGILIIQIFLWALLYIVPELSKGM